jgi:ribose transport system substrate-binding protein
LGLKWRSNFPFPRLKAVFAVSATATEGAILAIQRRGFGHTIVLVGCDNYLVLLSDLRAGRMDLAIVSDNDQMGYLAAKAVLDAIHGRALPGPQHVSPRLLTRDDLGAQSGP